MSTIHRPGLQVLVLCLVLALPGCGSGYHPVRGTITLHDGTPLTKGLVIFERIEGSPAVAARGNVQPDGRFELSTARTGDGVPLGRYKMVINPLDASDAPDEDKVLPFDVKYVNLASTDLEFEVKAGINEMPIKLAPPTKRKPRR